MLPEGNIKVFYFEPCKFLSNSLSWPLNLLVQYATGHPKKLPGQNTGSFLGMIICLLLFFC
jgi:hypothetical protein